MATPKNDAGAPLAELELLLAKPQSGGFGWDRGLTGCPLYGPDGLPNWDGLHELHVPGATTDDIPQAVLFERGGGVGEATAQKAAEQKAAAAKAAAEEAQKPPPPPPPPPVEKEEKTFVAIELVDSDGKPVGNLKYQVKLPDGSLKEGTLDGSGKARVEGVPLGEAEIKFPDLHEEDWGAG